MPGSVHSGSASWHDCGRAFLDELRVSSFSRYVPIVYLDSIVSPLRLRWIKGVCVSRCNLPLALLAEWPGSLTCHYGNTGRNEHWIRVSTQSWLWRGNFSHRSCRDSNSQPFNNESGALTNELSRSPQPQFTNQLWRLRIYSWKDQ